MEEFPSNSKNPERKPRVESVVAGDIKRRKQPIYKRLGQNFVQGDAQSVGGFVLFDVLLPAAKDMVADAFSQGIERMLFGEARSASRRTGWRPGGGQSGYVNYTKPSTAVARKDESRMSRRGRATHSFDEIVIPTRPEAEAVMEGLSNVLDQYEQVTVADLYDLVGEDGAYTDNKWGWTSLKGSDITRVRDGYLLDLPRPEPLD